MELKIMKAPKSILFAVSAMLASGCAEVPGSDVYDYTPRTAVNQLGTYNALSTMSVMGTDKTIIDHLVSFQRGKDCSTVRMEQGRTYCREDEPNPQYEGYCYRTLGDVTCYEQPNPGVANAKPVGTPY